MRTTTSGQGSCVTRKAQLWGAAIRPKIGASASHKARLGASTGPACAAACNKVGNTASPPAISAVCAAARVCGTDKAVMTTGHSCGCWILATAANAAWRTLASPSWSSLSSGRYSPANRLSPNTCAAKMRSVTTGDATRWVSVSPTARIPSSAPLRNRPMIAACRKCRASAPR